MLAAPGWHSTHRTALLAQGRPLPGSQSAGRTHESKQGFGCGAGAVPAGWEPPLGQLCFSELRFTLPWHSPRGRKIKQRSRKDSFPPPSPSPAHGESNCSSWEQTRLPPLHPKETQPSSEPRHSSPKRRAMRKFCALLCPRADGSHTPRNRAGLLPQHRAPSAPLCSPPRITPGRCAAPKGGKHRRRAGGAELRPGNAQPAVLRPCRHKAPRSRGSAVTAEARICCCFQEAARRSGLIRRGVSACEGGGWGKKPNRNRIGEASPGPKHHLIVC